MSTKLALDEIDKLAKIKKKDKRLYYGCICNTCHHTKVKEDPYSINAKCTEYPLSFSNNVFIYPDEIKKLLNISGESCDGFQYLQANDRVFILELKSTVRNQCNEKLVNTIRILKQFKLSNVLTNLNTFKYFIIVRNINDEEYKRAVSQGALISEAISVLAIPGYASTSPSTITVCGINFKFMIRRCNELSDLFN